MSSEDRRNAEEETRPRTNKVTAGVPLLALTHARKSGKSCEETLFAEGSPPTTTPNLFTAVEVVKETFAAAVGGGDADRIESAKSGAVVVTVLRMCFRPVHRSGLVAYPSPPWMRHVSGR